MSKHFFPFKIIVRQLCHVVPKNANVVLPQMRSGWCNRENLDSPPLTHISNYNHCESLNNTGVNCMGPLIHNFYFTKNILLLHNS